MKGVISVWLDGFCEEFCSCGRFCSCEDMVKCNFRLWFSFWVLVLISSLRWLLLMRVEEKEKGERRLLST